MKAQAQTLRRNERWLRYALLDSIEQERRLLEADGEQADQTLAALTDAHQTLQTPDLVGIHHAKAVGLW